MVFDQKSYNRKNYIQRKRKSCIDKTGGKIKRKILSKIVVEGNKFKFFKLQYFCRI